MENRGRLKNCAYGFGNKHVVSRVNYFMKEEIRYKTDRNLLLF